jgi:sugar lactone lactonase YvrE
MVAVEIALRTNAAVGECPLWEPREQRLYWVDIEGREIHRFDPATGGDELRMLPGRPGSMVRTDEPGRLLVAMETKLVWFDWASGEAASWMELEPPGTGNRMNDGRTDPVGRYWVGSMYERPADRRYTGMLHRIDRDGAAVTAQTEIGVSNALAFDAERSRMYFADTLRDTVWCYDYDLETGEAHDEAPFIDFTDLPGGPDGACVDTDGCLWVAAVYGWRVLRFTPNGKLDRTIELPVQAPTMPAFGGPNLDTMFVTSIGSGASREMVDSDVPAGSLLAIDAGVRGHVDPPFGAGSPES